MYEHKPGGLPPVRLGAALVLGAMAVMASPAQAQPASSGLTGLINMPSGRMEQEGLFTAGYSRTAPYSAPYLNIQMFSWLQVAGRYTRISGTKALTDDYGANKDKAAAFKVRLLPENAWGVSWLPEVSLGMDDFHGTKLFHNEFIAASKRFQLWNLGDADVTVGYGRKRIDGAFGGVRFTPSALPSWSVVAEYDATNFQKDNSVEITGVNERRTGNVHAALEYRWGGFSVRAGREHGNTAFNLAVSIPLQQRDLIPKMDETGPFNDGNWFLGEPRPTALQWEQDRSYRQGMLRSLHEEGLRDVRVAYVDGVMSLSISGSRHLHPSRAAGRAARIAMAYAPIETSTLEITWEALDLQGLTWTFYNVPMLSRYFAGTATRKDLRNSVRITYADPDGRTAASQHNDLDAVLDAAALTDGGYTGGMGGSPFAWSFGTHGQTTLSLSPYISSYLNDPSGAFKYDIGLIADARAHLARGWWLDGAIKGSVFENVSDVTQPSNSLLPHVRSDLAEYRQASRVKLSKLLVNKYWQPGERVYLRASGGLYEEMYGGAGGQALYLGRDGNWGADLAVDFLKQRNFKGTGFMDYRTHTVIGSLHYRLPLVPDTTATIRAGRFLAGDRGARFEIKRTFRSGVELGLWYTRTNGDDITSPGSPGNPYYDKGVFMRIPLATLSTRDNGSVVHMSLSPWNRDVGQMVQSPGDLYQMAEQHWLQNALDGDGLRSFGDVYGEEDQP